MQMQPKQFLINKDSEKRKILGVSGEVFAVSWSNDFKRCEYWWTEEDIKNFGWSLLEEPWVPKDADKVYVVTAYGTTEGPYPWSVYRKEAQEYLIKTGNYARTEADAELYKQKLIERMGSNS